MEFINRYEDLNYNQLWNHVLDEAKTDSKINYWTEAYIFNHEETFIKNNHLKRLSNGMYAWYRERRSNLFRNRNWSSLDEMYRESIARMYYTYELTVKRESDYLTKLNVELNFTSYELKFILHLEWNKTLDDYYDGVQCSWRMILYDTTYWVILNYWKLSKCTMMKLN